MQQQGGKNRKTTATTLNNAARRFEKFKNQIKVPYLQFMIHLKRKSQLKTLEVFQKNSSHCLCFLSVNIHPHPPVIFILKLFSNLCLFFSKIHLKSKSQLKTLEVFQKNSSHCLCFLSVNIHPHPPAIFILKLFSNLCLFFSKINFFLSKADKAFFFYFKRVLFLQEQK